MLGRERGGSRPGLAKAFGEELGSGNPIRLLSPVTSLATDGFTGWYDDFSGSALGGVWSAASWLDASPGVLADINAAAAEALSVGAVRDALSIDASQAYVVEIYVVPRGGSHWGEYQVAARMDDTTPDASEDGIIAELVLTGAGGTYSGTLKHYASGVETEYAFSTGNVGTAKPGWFTVLVNGNVVSCHWQGVQLVSQTVGAAAGSRVGFGIETTVAGGVCLVGGFRVQYYESGYHESQRTRLVASSNGVLYREGWYGQMEEVTTGLTLASDRLVRAQERGQKLYIADWDEPRASETDGVIDATGLELTSVSVSDWTALGILTADDTVYLSNVGGATVAGTYKISSVVAGKVTLASSAGGAGTATFRVVRAPKIYDPVANTLVLWTPTAGQVPDSCPCIALYRDRMVLGGAPENPHVWYMTRAGDPLDFDYSGDDEDAARAVAATDADAGLVGEPIRAIVSWSDEYCLFGLRSQLWVLRGDPAYNAHLDCLSYVVGIVGPAAWAHGPGGEVYFLSHDGLYVANPAQMQAPVALGQDRLPLELKSVNGENYDVQLAYDHKFQGVHVFVVGREEVDVSHWWVDLRNGSWWPVTLGSSHEPTALLRYQGDVSSGVLLGGRDGYVREFRNECGTDDGTEFTSTVDYGPMALVADESKGIVGELTGRLAQGSGDVSWSLHLADTAEEAPGVAAGVSGTWSEGLNARVRPRRSGYAAVLRLAGASGVPWAVEGVGARVGYGGPTKP